VIFQNSVTYFQYKGTYSAQQVSKFGGAIFQQAMIKSIRNHADYCGKHCQTMMKKLNFRATII